eukprot:1848913-Prymnesium_polylepis.2
MVQPAELVVLTVARRESCPNPQGRHCAPLSGSSSKPSLHTHTLFDSTSPYAQLVVCTGGLLSAV